MLILSEISCFLYTYKDKNIRCKVFFFNNAENYFKTLLSTTTFIFRSLKPPLYMPLEGNGPI